MKQRPLYLVWERFGFHGTSLEESGPSAGTTKSLPNDVLPKHSFLGKDDALRQVELAKK